MTIGSHGSWFITEQIIESLGFLNFSLFHFFDQFALIGSYLFALTFWEPLISQVNHRMTFVAFNHTTVTNHPSVITLKTSIWNVCCTIICWSLSFFKTLNLIPEIISMRDVKEFTKKLRNLKLAFPCMIGFIGFDHITEHSFSERIGFGFDKGWYINKFSQ